MAEKKESPDIVDMAEEPKVDSAVPAAAATLTLPVSSNSNTKEDVQIAPATNETTAAVGGGIGGGGGGLGGGGGRKRKRHLYNAIRAQMEFYFGDANLSKDRFLRRHIDNDPFVPLDIFLTFNKIKALTQDVQEIAKSLSNSKLLQLDVGGLKVRRKTPLPDARNVTDKTLYVEALPANASHDWLKQVFSRYGPVAYVSLPHYPGTRKIKEFAFIEFERSVSVEKAVKAFSQVQGVLAVDQTDPSNLASIRSFRQEQQQQQAKHKSSGEEATTDPIQAALVAELARKPALKREGESDDADESAVAAKRAKLDTTETAVADAAANDAGSKHSETEQSDNHLDEDTVESDESELPAKTTKRHRKRKKQSSPIKPNIDASALELKVLPKTGWASLRNKYLNLQRRMVSEAKAKLWRHEHGQQPQHKRTPMQSLHQHNPQQLLESKASNSGGSSGHEETESLSDNGDADAPIQPKRRKRNKGSAGGGGGVHKMNMNFYGAGGGEADESRPAVKAENPAQERTPLFKYEPGLIVECSLLESCSSVKEFKADMRQYPDIKYVDIKEGDQLAHLRLATPNAAEELLRQLNCAEMKCKVLRGQSELKYWRKIEQDREAKLTKQVRVQQRRGREKVAKILAKHTKFEDADEELGEAGSTDV